MHNMGLWRLLGGIILGFLIFGATARADVPPAATSNRLTGVWASLSIGSDLQGWPASNVNLNFATQRDRLYLVRVGGILEDSKDKSPDRAVAEMAFLFGKRFHWLNPLSVCLAAGPALTSIAGRGEYLGTEWDSDEGRDVRKYKETIQASGGLALDAQAMIPLFNVVGAGLDVFGNLNGYHSYGAVSFCLSLGYIH